ncbi:adenylate/guanylate cyclase domain-containing protein [Coleofasciculus sp. FACHB-SPT36]|uniref:adenylate/guanylate cyclase domain-containing protein n=1 Tax=Cyanophyceae TaxID=3028117 RepID=UPI001F54F6B7|nr:adenylate/guanylate cyclase domain-containing protein [Coleofasciculus sp. FACHB-SPT36]
MMKPKRGNFTLDTSRLRLHPLSLGKLWHRLSITSKFTWAVVALLLLITQVAMTSWLSLNAVVRETEAAILTSIEVQAKVFQMDAALQDARQLEKDFFLSWPSMGFSSASQDYVQAHREQIDKALDISSQLQELLNGGKVSDALRRSNPELVAYVELVERYASSFKEAVALVGTLGIDDVGVLARLEQNSRLLHDTLQLSASSELMISYREMQSVEKEYLSNRQEDKIQAVYEAVERLRQGIQQAPQLNATQKAAAWEYLNAYELAIREIINLDAQIRSKISTFDEQAASVSTKVIGLANADVQRSRLEIARTSTLATVLQAMTVLTAVLLSGVIANIFATALKNLQAEQEKSERLLLNIFPEAIAHRLKQEQRTIAENFADVTVLFADIVGFTELSARISPTDVVELLNQIFSAFDRLADRHGLEKIKTIGDAYMVVGGLPMPSEDHAEAIAEMALDMLEEMTCLSTKIGEALSTSRPQHYTIRIGINTGPVVAGVIGTKKFIYDLWGDTVNIASRMESQGIAGCIQVTGATYERLRHKYQFQERGTIQVKGKGEMKSFLLKGRHQDDSP